MPESLWAAYSPDDKTPWDLKRVVHLHRRAAFAGTWDELQRDVKDGPEKAVTRLLDGKANLHAAKSTTPPPRCWRTRPSRRGRSAG